MKIPVRIKSNGNLQTNGELVEFPPALLGVRNLAQGTNTDRWYLWNTSRSAISFSKDETDGRQIIKVSVNVDGDPTNAGARQNGPYNAVMKLKQGERYTLSFKVRGTVGVRMGYTYIMNNPSPNQSVGSAAIPIESETEWQTVEYSFYMTHDVPSSSVMIAASGVTFGKWFEFKDVTVKHYDGLPAHATPWTPAPEDLGLNYPDSIKSFGGPGFTVNGTTATKITEGAALAEKTLVSLNGGGLKVAGEWSEYPDIVEDGLLLWYDFMGRSNADHDKTVAIDLSGSGNDGSLVGFDYTTDSGYTNDGLLFDGVDDRIRVPSAPSIEQLGGFHLDINVSKIKNTDYSGGVIALLRTQYSNRLNLGVKPLGFYFGFYNPVVSWNGKHIPFDAVTTNISVNFKIIEKDSSNNITNYLVEIYVDGALFATTFDRAVYKYSNLARELTFGWQATNTSSPTEAYLKDAMTSVKFYDRLLTQEEIVQNYEAEKGRWRS